MFVVLERERQGVLLDSHPAQTSAEQAETSLNLAQKCRQTSSTEPLCKGATEFRSIINLLH